ncbi:MAG: putative amidophosphoribosyltransferase [Actinomycetia bacterium]|nr:putative amidophosphoribosyltransferase [Actinomycetes bacterium]
MLAGLVEAVFPVCCAGCGRRGEAVCATCAYTLTPAPTAAAPAFVDDWFALCSYDGVARELVARIKYRNARAVVPWFADALAANAQRRWRAATIDCVTWAPTTTARRHARGFDHAELLARRTARTLRVPCRALLARVTNEPQTGRVYAVRRNGPTFRTVAGVPRTVLLLDDVTTTGATLRAAARALRARGATRVLAATIARTPPPGRRSVPPGYSAPR